MTDKNKLQNVMQQRNPLKPVVQPVDIYTSPDTEAAGKKQSGFTQSRKSDNQESNQSGKPFSTAPNKIDGVHIKKYTTHLPAEMIKAIKQRALDTDRKDYEVMYEAMSQYFEKNKR